jgi:hypothetical protein
MFIVQALPAIFSPKNVYGIGLASNFHQKMFIVQALPTIYDQKMFTAKALPAIHDQKCL